MRRVAGGLASALVGAAFVVGIVVFMGMPEGGRPVFVRLFEWISVGSFQAPVELRVDPLSMVMVLTVTGVGFLIHVYSIDYMHGDPRYPRFFAYMNLFVFFMLTLVLANNFVLLYVGWEGVGLCSYLLIAFWFERKVAADAGKKAFIVTRIGDTAMLIGVLLIFASVGSVEFDQVFSRGALQVRDSVKGRPRPSRCCCSPGPWGSRPRLPLHTWLPDAMEGPTPVSALIHAATMVTAGVYLVARTFPLFEISEVALVVVAVVGTVTALYAALAAIGQDDLKRVLAYSTISQLGYMFLAVGVGAFAIGIFHLVTHAFFKALMFLAAGSVMHATDGEIDMTRLGGLRKPMPVTAALFAIGGLPLAGIPRWPGSSARTVLASAFEAGHTALWVVGLATAGLTAFYVARATALTFLGRPRHDKHPHEAPALMRIPMLVLAAGAILGGLLGLSPRTGAIQTFLEPVFGQHAATEPGDVGFALSMIAAVVARRGWRSRLLVYASRWVDWTALQVRLRLLHVTLAKGFFVDDVRGCWSSRARRRRRSWPTCSTCA